MKKQTTENQTRRSGGFTLVELLVVIIIIAVLASIALPTFLGQRQKAQDTAAYTLVRNALTAVQGEFVTAGDYRLITIDMLADTEPSITWVESAVSLVTTSPPAIIDAVGADAEEHEVAVCFEAAGIVDLATVSTSGNSFGIQIDNDDLSQIGYVKVKVIDGTADIGW